MKKQKNNFLVFSCHPDDAEIGMGGTIARLASAGHRVKIVDLTDGEPTPCGTPEKRIEESSKAAGILKFEREILGWENRKLVFDIKKRDLVAAVIRRERPYAVFIPFEKDTHPDHREGWRICLDAVFTARLCRYPIEGEPFRTEAVYSYLSIHFKKPVYPDVYVPLNEEEHSLKMQSIRCYVSQFTENTANTDIPDFIKARDRFFGYMCGAPYAEGFKVYQGPRADFLSCV